MNESSKFYRKSPCEKCDDDDSTSDEDEDEEPKWLAEVTDVVALPPTGVGNFGDVNVEESKNVHLGNRTLYKGPVTIQQIFNSHPTSDLRISSKEDVEKISYTSSDSSIKEKESKFFSKKHVAVSLTAGTLTLALIFVMIVWMYNEDDDAFSVPPTSNGPVMSDSDLPMVNRSEWKAENYTYHRIKLDQPENVIIGHTSGEHCYFKSNCIYLLQQMQRSDHKYIDEIRYNFLIGGDGYIYEGRGWDFAGAITSYSQYIYTSLGIALMGNFDEARPTSWQIQATKELLNFATKNKKVTENYKLLGLSQIDNRTSSPGYEVAKIIRDWKHWTDLNN